MINKKVHSCSIGGKSVQVKSISDLGMCYRLETDCGQVHAICKTDSYEIISIYSVETYSVNDVLITSASYISMTTREQIDILFYASPSDKTFLRVLSGKHAGYITFGELQNA